MISHKSTMLQVMAWCHQATSHYLRQCWPRSNELTLKFHCFCSNLCHFFKENFYIFYNFSILIMHRLMNSNLMEGKDPIYLCGCWWPGDTWSQGSSWRDTNLLFLGLIYKHELTNLTLNVWGSSYLGLIRSISWLLMPWLLTSPGRQQPWYWLCRIGRFLSCLRKDFNYLRRNNVEKWHKMWIYIYVPSEKFSTQRVKHG